jgi:hypothetical protein
MTSLLQRFPSTSAIPPVYSVIAVPIFGWTLTSWLWKLPSWINFLTPGEITAILFYAMMTAFLESLLICSFVVLLCFIWPTRTFRDRFVVRGTWLAIGLSLSVLGHGVWRGMTRFTYAEVSLVTWSIFSLLVIAVLTFLSGRVRFLALLAEWISDRLTVFLYILIPVSILSILVVLFRNFFSG